MRKLQRIITLLFSIVALSSSAQIFKPVHWSFEVGEQNGNEAELIFKAKIDSGWHLYSQYVGDVTLPTTFIFTSTANFDTLGTVKEGKPILKYEKVFDAEVLFFEHEAEFKQKVKIKSDSTFTIKGEINYIVCNDSMCVGPETAEFEFKLQGAGEKKNDSSEIIDESGSQSLIGIFIAGFLGGLLALLTPCVFPMIPMTVTFFTKRSGNRRKGVTNAIIYATSIIVIYVLLGVLITLITGDAQTLNQMSSDVWFNLAFFFIFVIFGISFLGAFEIVLPSSFVNKVDKASDRGGLIGIFFMAFTLSLVSFSCTGPIIGTLLVEAAVSGNILGPATGMTGFAVALALPFGLFAAFPGWLNSLPKSGGWLNSVKVVLGLLELALALKFLSTVDLAYHWGILTREIFISLWIVIFAITGFYLIGKIKFSHDSDLPYVSIPRLLFALVAFGFTFYLIPGLWGAPLKLVSGILPPSYYSENVNLMNNSSTAATEVKTIKGVDRSKCPHGLNCFHDYNEALAYAKEVNKPLMVDFTGYACVNCRKMEDNVWSDPTVLQRLQNDYVLVSLYVDDKTKLPEEEQIISPTTGKKVKTLGNRWSDLQISRYGRNSQPWYVLLDHNEKELTAAKGYTPNVEEYVKFLDEGVKMFKK